LNKLHFIFLCFISLQSQAASIFSREELETAITQLQANIDQQILNHSDRYAFKLDVTEHHWPSGKNDKHWIITGKPTLMLIETSKNQLERLDEMTVDKCITYRLTGIKKWHCPDNGNYLEEKKNLRSRIRYQSPVGSQVATRLTLNEWGTHVTVDNRSAKRYHYRLDGTYKERHFSTENTFIIDDKTGFILSQAFRTKDRPDQTETRQILNFDEEIFLKKVAVYKKQVVAIQESRPATEAAQKALMKKGQYIATALSLLILALLSYLRLKKKSRHPFIFAFFIIPVVTYLGLYPLILLLTLTTGGLQDMLFSAVTWNLVKDLEYTHEMRLVVSISIKIFIYFLLSWLMTYWLISWIARRKFSKEN